MSILTGNNKQVDDIKDHEDMVFPDMSVAVIFMMHKYLTVFNYTIDLPTKSDAVFSLADPDGDFKAELLANGKVIEFGLELELGVMYEKHLTKKKVIDFYAQSAAMVARDQEGKTLDRSVDMFEPKTFESYDDAYFILKCYYHDLSGFQVVIPDCIKDGVLITLSKDDLVVELIDGWQIVENGEVLTNKCFIEIIELEEIIKAKSPKRLGVSMGFFETMMYWDLRHQTEITISKRKKAQMIKTYLVHNPNSNLYKIGKSINPEKRVVDIQGMAGNPLKLLYVIHSDVERELHTKFATQCHYSEWFTDEGGSIQAYFRLNGVAQ
ncbi:GIY-YIG nuclease family protein [Psychrobacter sp. ASPA161_6]|uniref:GIY-YIG nuclease family protein n=1 Tax=Psychrobacter sp. ASPA161_6 TaxID=3160962 RepID=UPI003F7FEAF3